MEIFVIDYWSCSYFLFIWARTHSQQYSDQYISVKYLSGTNTVNLCHLNCSLQWCTLSGYWTEILPGSDYPRGNNIIQCRKKRGDIFIIDADYDIWNRTVCAYFEDTLSTGYMDYKRRGARGICRIYWKKNVSGIYIFVQCPVGFVGWNSWDVLRPDLSLYFKQASCTLFTDYYLLHNELYLWNCFNEVQFWNDLWFMVYG